MRACFFRLDSIKYLYKQRLRKPSYSSMGYQAADGIIMSWPGRKQSSPEILCMTHSTNGTHGVSWFQLQKSWSWFAFINWIEHVSILKRFGNETVSNDFFVEQYIHVISCTVCKFIPYIYVYIYSTYIYIYICTCVNIYIYKYIYNLYKYIYIYINIFVQLFPTHFQRIKKNTRSFKFQAKIWTELQCQVPTRWGSSKSSALTKGFVSTATATYLRAPFRRSEKFRQGIFHFSQEKTRSKGLRLKMTFWKRVRAHCH